MRKCQTDDQDLNYNYHLKITIIQPHNQWSLSLSRSVKTENCTRLPTKITNGGGDTLKLP